MANKEIIFFFDNQMSPYIVKGLKVFSQNVIHLRKEFDAATPDIDWLPVVGSRGWIVITRDKRILKNPAEKELFLQYNIGGIFLDDKGLNRCGQIEQIIRHWRTIKQISSATPKPFAYRFFSRKSGYKEIDLHAR